MSFAVRGQCMRGIADGDSARVRRQRFYIPGDVVVVRRRDYWDAHRFLGYAPTVNGPVALTQSDSASQRDPAASIDAIVGRVQCGVSALDRLAALGKYVRVVLLRLAKGGR